MRLPIKLALAEDHGALREGYLALFKSTEDIDIVFDASDGKELLEKLKVVRPQILLLDLEMPKMTGLEVLELMRTKYPSVKVMIVSGHFQKDYIIEAFKLGAKAFLKKEFKMQTIIEAIKATDSYGGYIDIEVGLILAEEIRNMAGKPKTNLTEQQLTVLKLICKGYTNKEAAEELDLTISAIKFHRANIMERTKSQTMQDLVAYALKNRLIEAK